MFDAAQSIRRKRISIPSDEEMLTGLAALRTRAGFITRALIDANLELPSVSSYRSRLAPWRKLTVAFGMSRREAPREGRGRRKKHDVASSRPVRSSKIPEGAAAARCRRDKDR
jgi:hypothetical protein